MSRKIVLKIDGDTNPKDVYCTTYQMRNFFRQLGDGFFSSLDVMNYIQHLVAVDRMRSKQRVLDVCCGRGLLLPLIRWSKKSVEYVGVDISEKNLKEQARWSGNKNISDEGLEYYSFPIRQVVCSCEEMSSKLEHKSFDCVIYTSAIEHMQKEVGYRSLENCFELMKDDGWMFLSCPNTQDKTDPYDTQYAAHVYEWGLGELREALDKVGFEVTEEYGLVGKVRDFEKFMGTQSAEEQDLYRRFKNYLPSKFLMAFMPILYPEGAAEVLLICKKKGHGVSTKKVIKDGKKKSEKRKLLVPPVSANWEKDFEAAGVKVPRHKKVMKLLSRSDTMLISNCSRTKGTQGDVAFPKKFYLGSNAQKTIKFAEQLNIPYGILSDLYGIHYHDEALAFYDIHPTEVPDKEELARVLKKKCEERGVKQVIYCQSSPAMGRFYIDLLLMAGLKVYYVTSLRAKPKGFGLKVRK